MRRWAVPVECRHGVDGGAVLWRRNGALFVTAVVKATFTLRHGGVAELSAPRPLVVADEPSVEVGVGIPAASPRTAHDLAPYLPQADVTLVGHAHAPAGKPATSAAARFALLRGEVLLLERRVTVVGDRARDGATIEPFVLMPLVYERAVGGHEHPDNPFGKSQHGAGPAPNLFDPTNAARPAALGPVAPRTPARARLLGHAPALAWTGRILEVPSALPWEYFHAAPPWQRCAYLCGDEALVLEGLHPEFPSLRTRLPGLVGRAWLTRTPATPPVALELVADTLVVDADRASCELVWRGHAALGGPAELGELELVCALEQAPETAVRPRSAHLEIAPPAFPAVVPFRAVRRRRTDASTLPAPRAPNPALPAGFSGAKVVGSTPPPALPFASPAPPTGIPGSPAGLTAGPTGIPAPVGLAARARAAGDGADGARASFGAKLRAARVRDGDIERVLAALRFPPERAEPKHLS